MIRAKKLKRIALGVLIVCWFALIYMITPTECLYSTNNAVPKHCVD